MILLKLPWQRCRKKQGGKESMRSPLKISFRKIDHAPFLKQFNAFKVTHNPFQAYILEDPRAHDP